MKSRRDWPHFLFAGGLALVLYVVSFHACEYRRNFKGPWQVTFTTAPDGAPALLINQPRLRITNVQLVFAGEPKPDLPEPQTVAFATPTNQPAFGKVVFRDTTFLPGTLTLDLYGHEIELLPRVLVLDRREHPWQSGVTIVLPRTNESAADRPSD